MATGYTSKLMDGNYNLKKWLKEDISRGFGLLLSLRDESNLSEEEILDKLNDESSYYYVNAKNKCLEDIKKFQEADEAILREEFLLHQNDSKQHRERRISELKKESVKFNAVKEQLLDAQQKASGEVIPCILDFAISQISLHLENIDYSYFEKPTGVERMCFEEWKVSAESDLEQHLVRYEKHLLKEQTRNKRNIDAYKELIKFVDDNIK